MFVRFARSAAVVVNLGVKPGIYTLPVFTARVQGRLYTLPVNTAREHG